MCVYLSITDTARPVARPRLPFGVVRCAECSLLFMCVTVVIARERSVECRWPPEGLRSALAVPDRAVHPAAYAARGHLRTRHLL